MRVFMLAAAMIWAGFVSAETLPTSQGDLKLDKMVDGLDEPWAIDFLPNGAVLITERDGVLRLLSDGKIRRVRGVPDVVANGQGGLLDVMVPRDFAQTRQVYLTHSARTDGGAHTALSVGQLSQDGTRLGGVREIFQAGHGTSGGRHFGSRIVEGADGTLFVTIGDRGQRDEAQNLASHHGTVIRINRDGSIPADNPFVNTVGARPEVWSYGHRNPQGASLDLNGRLWVVEHGAAGGDEVNRVKRGANYGWPVISYGTHYSGAKIGEGTAKDGMQQPNHYWDPSIAPSGMMIYSGKLWPQWRGAMFVGSLKFDYISRLSRDGSAEVEQIKSPATERLRHIAEAPDGTIWFLSVGQDALYRISK